MKLLPIRIYDSIPFFFTPRPDIFTLWLLPPFSFFVLQHREHLKRAQIDFVGEIFEQQLYDATDTTGMPRVSPLMAEGDEDGTDHLDRLKLEIRIPTKKEHTGQGEGGESGGGGRGGASSLLDSPGGKMKRGREEGKFGEEQRSGGDGGGSGSGGAEDEAAEFGGNGLEGGAGGSSGSGSSSSSAKQASSPTHNMHLHPAVTAQRAAVSLRMAHLGYAAMEGSARRRAMMAGGEDGGVA